MLQRLFRNALIAGAATVVLSGAALAQETTLKLGHLANEENSWHKAAVKFGEELEKLTDGRIAVEVYPNESLGAEMDLINGMQLGTADMTITGESLQNWAPKAALLAIPYAYTALEAMDEVAGGEIGDEIEAQIIETAQPTPMAFSEVFTSLQNGTIDAQENPLALINSANFAEVQDYVNLTEHVRSWIYLTISEMAWANLSEEDQAAVMQAAKTAQDYERELFLKDEEAFRQTLKDKGMEFVEVDTQAFAAKAKDAVLANVSEEIRPTVESLFAN